MHIVVQHLTNLVQNSILNPNITVTYPGAPVDERERVLGTSTSSERVLVVDFRWFILPAVLYVIVAVFFIVTMITTRRETPIWKSSPLPLLHAMSEEGSVETVRMFKKENKKCRMRLGRTAKGWQLVEERTKGDTCDE
jgi:hypothetical protein